MFAERRGRFLESERSNGWHVQYDGIEEGVSFIRPAASLIPYDSTAARMTVAVRNRSVEELEAALEPLRVEVERHASR